MQVAEVARSLRATPATIRRWSYEFAEVLHPRARGGSEAPRQFDEYDLQVLRRAAELLASPGATYTQVKAQLKVEFDPRATDNKQTARITPVYEAGVDEQGALSEMRDAGADRPGATAPPLEELVAAAVSSTLREHLGRFSELAKTVDTLNREVRDLKTRIVALEETLFSGRRRWPF